MPWRRPPPPANENGGQRKCAWDQHVKVAHFRKLESYKNAPMDGNGFFSAGREICLILI